MNKSKQSGSATLEAALISLFFIGLISLSLLVLQMAASSSLAHHFGYEAMICSLEGRAVRTCKATLEKTLSQFKPLFSIKTISLHGQPHDWTQLYLELKVQEKTLQISKSLNKEAIKKAVR